MKTMISQNAVVWGESIDNSTADQKTQEMMKHGTFDKVEEWSSKALESSEIAAAVKEIILGGKSNFRCLTNVDFLAEEIASKLKDPASNEPIELMANRLYGDQKSEN